MTYNQLLHIIQVYKIADLAYALGLLILGYYIAKRFSMIVERTLGTHFSRHHVILLSRFIFYITFIIFAVLGLQQLGFKLSVLLGAAGVFTVAISFASQTAVSNLISGIFLLFEHPFKMGDQIEVKGISGIVESIDLLSTKIKTFDNTLVRIPNEALIKSEITNLSYYSTRRINIISRIAYSNDISAIKELLIRIANECPKVLKEPAPSVNISKFAEASVELTLLVWAHTSDISTIRNQIQEGIKQAFDAQGIEMPTSQLTIHQAVPQT